MASLSCPDCGVKVQPEDLICFRCGANLPHHPGPDDDVLTPTISQRRVKSSIAVTSGQTVLLAGLISETESKQRQGIPLLDSIPGADRKSVV